MARNSTKKKRGAPIGNKNAQISERGGFTMRIKAGYAEMLYAAALSQGNPSPSQPELAELVEAALAQCYQRTAEDEKSFESML